MNLDNISLDDIYDFIDSKSGKISPEIERYLELMDKVRGMHYNALRFGSKERIIKHLMKVEGLSRFLANKIYNNAMEYFFCDNEISKQAWRNVIAERQDRLINMAIALAKDVSDLAKISKMNIDLAPLLGLDKEDAPELPQELFDRPFKLYSYDAKMLGIPTAVDRKKLSKLIDDLPELTEKERSRIRQEALLEPLILLPEDHENVRKSE